MAKAKSSKKEMMDYDQLLALELQQRYDPIGLTENAVFPHDRNKENYAPRTLIDQTLEVVDPTPNIHTLFMQFNAKFFSNKLLSVEVKWSPRMTSCAGVCTFQPRSRDCVISLSAPLLKLRPRKDLVETLLHEMIHGFLFLTNNNRDRDGHGPEFCKHMDRINKEAGTNITIYHTFHDEVKLYRQHWWRCNGPCQSQAPYFGMVRRAMNRAPGPSDCWWQRHQQSCGGTYVKVREPENFKSKSKKSGDDKKNSAVNNKNKPPNGKLPTKMDDFFAKPQEKPKPAVTLVNGSLVSVVKPNSNGTQSAEAPKYPVSGSNKLSKSGSVSGVWGKPITPTGLVKLGTSTNRVHGWGTGGPGSSTGGSSKSPNASSNKGSGVKPSQTLSFVATVGGVGTGRSSLLDKYSPSSPHIGTNSRPSKKAAPTVILDSPPPKKPKVAVTASTPVLRLNNPDVEELYNCPVCDTAVPNSSLNDHLDNCLVAGSEQPKNTKSGGNRRPDGKSQSAVIVISPESPGIARGSEKSPSTSTPMKGQTNLDAFVISPEQTATKHYPCPVCNKSLDMNLLNEHLDKCLAGPAEKERKDKAKRSVLIMEGPPAGPSGASKSKDVVDTTDDITGTGEPYVCLVCNAKIRGDIALNDHLDECVQAIFNDDEIDSANDSSLSINSPADDHVEVDDRFPCPICMKLIAEKMMNLHLDTCLSGQNWD